MSLTKNMDPRWKWMLPFLIVDFPNRIFYGIFGSLIGPSQPYLAYATNVDLTTINLLWTLGSGFGMLGCFTSAIIFKRYLRSPSWKMNYFFACTLVMGIISALPPYCTSFTALVIAFGLRNLVGGLQETAAQAFLVYTMGPVSSRCLIMGFHFTVAIGFWLGPMIIKPFFPTTSSEHLCEGDDHVMTMNQTTTLLPTIDPHIMDSIKWPYWIVAIGHIAFSVGYIIVNNLPYKMPVHEEDESESNKNSKTSTSRSFKEDLFPIAAIIFLYAASCGSERLFQSMQFTFGFCGPLNLSPQEAVFTDECYNGGFMLGRLLSMIIVTLIVPKLMLTFSVTVCLIATILIAVEGGETSTYLYTGAALYGFAVSWQYGSGVAWTAEHMDIVGERTVVFHFGCMIGGALTPMIGGFLFRHFSPMSVWHFNFVCVAIQLLSFLSLHFIYKSRESGTSKTNAVYQKLNQDDVDDGD